MDLNFPLGKVFTAASKTLLSLAHLSCCCSRMAGSPLRRICKSKQRQDKPFRPSLLGACVCAILEVYAVCFAVPLRAILHVFHSISSGIHLVTLHTWEFHTAVPTAILVTQLTLPCVQTQTNLVLQHAVQTIAHLLCWGLSSTKDKQ